MKYAPIVLFVYNRPNHTKETLDSLVVNERFSEHKLYIFSDGKKGEGEEEVEDLRLFLKQYSSKYPNMELIFSKENKGLAKSIIEGVSKILERFDSVVVLEDDIVTSRYFLKYMQEALEYYKNLQRIGSISGFNYPEKVLNIPSEYDKDIYFSLRPSSWGWATWKDRWEKVDWEVKDYKEFERSIKLQKEFNKGGEDLSGMLKAQMEGKIDSWAIRWSYHHFKNKLLAVYPVVSFVDNIGNDGSGIHSKASNEDRFRNSVLNNKKEIRFLRDIKLDEKLIRNFQKIFAKDFRYILRKIKFKISQIIIK